MNFDKNELHNSIDYVNKAIEKLGIASSELSSISVPPSVNRQNIDEVRSNLNGLKENLSKFKNNILKKIDSINNAESQNESLINSLGLSLSKAIDTVGTNLNLRREIFKETNGESIIAASKKIAGALNCIIDGLPISQEFIDSYIEKYKEELIPQKEADLRNLVVSNLEKMVGIHETGTWHEKMVDWYNENVFDENSTYNGTKMQDDWAWCMLTVSYIFNFSGLGETTTKDGVQNMDENAEIFKSSAVWIDYAVEKAKNTFGEDAYKSPDYNPKVGDMIIFNFHTSDDGTDREHIGIVDKPVGEEDTYIVTIEGNHSGYEKVVWDGKQWIGENKFDRDTVSYDIRNKNISDNPYENTIEGFIAPDYTSYATQLAYNEAKEKGTAAAEAEYAENKQTIKDVIISCQQNFADTFANQYGEIEEINQENIDQTFNNRAFLLIDENELEKNVDLFVENNNRR